MGKKKKTRLEHDFLGEMEIPDDVYYGVQTLRALENFKKAGLSDYVDARLADAHELVKELEGPFDFVFSDADKNWYVNYFKDVDPKLLVGGCFTAHNISERSSGYQAEYLKYVRSLDNYESTLQPGSSILVSYKRTEK